MTAVLDRLSCQNWRVPVGISIGRTNTVAHTGHDDAIADVVSAFRKATESHVPFSYYELNISCPNLLKDISFYEPERFTQLMTAIRRLSLDKPLFVKMPIDLSNENTLALVDTALHFQVAALIFGNLQHDRTHPSFDAAEMEAHKKYKGNWSGMPCQARSDELVALAYRRAAGNIAIIGCGGVFTAEDAYRKIRLLPVRKAGYWIRYQDSEEQKIEFSTMFRQRRRMRLRFFHLTPFPSPRSYFSKKTISEKN
jgi:dihydroorotate dehydrogenase